ncbi:MAG: DNA repair protein RadA [Geminicoccaceae bacterium]|nr:MAG: DNA repair protein RadA [Geminicoccaceae bacterium]
MARARTHYACTACGASFPKWSGRCEACGAWNSLAEEQAIRVAGRPAPTAGRLQFTDLRSESEPPPRHVTAIDELDRVLGGGLVAGSAILIGGDPGIGKSTLMLQTAAALANAGAEVAYVSGEESVDQIRLRARRLGLQDAPVRLAAASVLGDILAGIDSPPVPRLVIVDSIQTVVHENLESAPGTVGQLRASADELVRWAKRRDAAILLVGHVTKEGQIAGPRVLEHMVDAVLYFEGERGHQFRILRAVKNRFGAANEIGVFEMQERGLVPVANPSGLFLAAHDDHLPGSVVFAGMEGTRPVLVEIQALVSPSAYGTARRAVVGWDAGRLAMLLAVLEARLGIALGGRDVFLNVAGGLKITEPAADLAVVAALLSSLAGKAIPPRTVVFGEVGLGGELRPVAHAPLRAKEAVKLGFELCWRPRLEEGDRTPGAFARLADVARCFEGLAPSGQR